MTSSLINQNKFVAVPFDLETSLQKVPYITPYLRSGSNTLIRGDLEDIWNNGDIQKYPINAENIKLQSDSAEDKPGSDGAHSIIISGLDKDYLFLEETIILNGVNPVITQNKFLRVHDLLVATTGTLKENFGNIQATTNVSNFNSGLINNGTNKTQNLQFTVPAGKTFVMTQLELIVGRHDSGEFIFRTRKFNNIFVNYITADVTEASIPLKFSPYVKFTEKTDISILARKVSGQEIRTSAILQGMLIDALWSKGFAWN